MSSPPEQAARQGVQGIVNLIAQGPKPGTVGLGLGGRNELRLRPLGGDAQQLLMLHQGACDLVAQLVLLRRGKRCGGDLRIDGSQLCDGSLRDLLDGLVGLFGDLDGQRTDAFNVVKVLLPFPTLRCG